ncbi:MAG TPA: hypothetical protein VMZ25_07770, partial [Terriglobales bacterium]|nr:hypothetical protein [Terriglobales bacterium]
MTSFHLLAVGADPSVLATRADVLKRAGYQVTTGSSEEAAQRLLGTGTFNVIVICHSFAPAQRARVVKAARAANPVPKIVVINRSPEPEAGAD